MIPKYYDALPSGLPYREQKEGFSKLLLTHGLYRYDDGMSVAGIIYLHDLSLPRVTRTARKNLEILHKLCGKKAVEKVILATTKWELVDEQVGTNFEKQLTTGFWKEIASSPGQIARFTGTSISAWQIIGRVLDQLRLKTPPTALRLQEELVDLQKLLPDTEVGRKLRSTLQELLKTQIKLEKELEDEAKNGSPDARERYQENRNQIRHTLSQIKSLKVPLSARIMSFFGLTVRL